MKSFKANSVILKVVFAATVHNSNSGIPTNEKSPGGVVEKVELQSGNIQSRTINK